MRFCNNSNNNTNENSKLKTIEPLSCRAVVYSSVNMIWCSRNINDYGNNTISSFHIYTHLTPHTPVCTSWILPWTRFGATTQFIDCYWILQIEYFRTDCEYYFESSTHHHRSFDIRKMRFKQMHPLCIAFCCALCLVCDAVTPFKNRGGGGGNSGVMMNTANSPNLLSPFLGSHGHPIRPQTYVYGDGFGDKYPSYQTQSPTYSVPSHNFLNKFHNHFSVHQPQTNKPRQFRNPFDIVYEWRQLDFEYPTFLDRQRAILNGDFIPINVVPLGVDRYRNRLFVTMPRWKNGIPASLASLPLPASDRSPPMRPYPSWDWHANPEALQPDCTRLMSVYRIWVDECDRLWVLDSGTVNATIQINQVCPPKILVFDLRTDAPIFSYELPPDQIKEDSLHSNLVVDIRNGRCNDAHAYITDVWRFGVVVFSLAKGRSWRTTNHFYFPNPEASDFTLNRLNFQWTDGVFGMSLSPVNEPPDRLLFFHPMSSYGVS